MHNKLPNKLRNSDETLASENTNNWCLMNIILKHISVSQSS